MNHLLLHCKTENIEQVLPIAVSRGLGVELTSFCYPPELEHPEELVAKHKRWLDGFAGLRSLHGAFLNLVPGAVEPLVREATDRRIRQAVGFALEMDASHLILHNGYYAPSRFDAEWLEREVSFWRGILTVVPDGLTIHIENAHEVSPDMQLALAKELDDPRIGLCLDIGHAHAFSSVPVVEWVEALGGRIAHVHLHDNDGSGDQHLPLGRGNIPLPEVLALLNQHAPNANWTIETEAVPSLAWLEEHHLI